MKPQKYTPDGPMLEEVGQNLLRARLAKNLTQAQVAEQAGISKRTVERLEAGSVGAQLSGFIRVCRVLGLLERFLAIVPETPPSPMEQLRFHGRQRQRAHNPGTYEVKENDDFSSVVEEPKPKSEWKWGDES